MTILIFHVEAYELVGNRPVHRAGIYHEIVVQNILSVEPHHLGWTTVKMVDGNSFLVPKHVSDLRTQLALAGWKKRQLA